MCGTNFVHKHKRLLDIDYRQLPAWKANNIQNMCPLAEQL